MSKRITKKKKSVNYIDVTLSFNKEVYEELKVMARAEYRSISNQIKYLMALGKDLLNSSNGAIISRAAGAEKEEEHLESAIGFKVGE